MEPARPFPAVQHEPAQFMIASITGGPEEWFAADRGSYSRSGRVWQIRKPDCSQSEGSTSEQMNESNIHDATERPVDTQ